MALLRTRTLPEVEPVVPVLRAEPFDDPAYLFEPKYDGFCGLLYVTPRECYFRSKRGNRCLNPLGHLLHLLRGPVGLPLGQRR